MIYICQILNSFIALASRFQQGSATLNTVNHHCLQESEKRPHGK